MSHTVPALPFVLVATPATVAGGASPGGGPPDLSALARRWGFYDSGHLSRLYRKYFGVTPKQGRKI